MNIKKLMHTRFMHNTKAISPIFATLILIAIAVIAGIVVYMFTSGTLAQMGSTGTAGQEKMAVQSVQYEVGSSAGAYTVTALVQNTATVDGVATGMIVKDSSGNTVASTTSVSTGTSTSALPAETLSTLVGTFAETADLPTGTYTVTVTTAAGGNFVSGTFRVS